MSVGGEGQVEPALDRLTVLRCMQGRRAAKLVYAGEAGPIVDGYDAGARFEVHELDVASLEELAARLDAVSLDHRAFVIRGEPLPGIDRTRARRLLYDKVEDDVTVTPATFRDVPRRWLMLDFDGLDAPALFNPLDGEVVGHWLRAKLPPAFAGCSFWWQMTGSAGFKPGVRCRLAFWLDRPVSEAEATRWLSSAPVDRSIFRAVQPIYIARPIFNGVADPVPLRSGVELDFGDTVAVPELPEPPPRPAPSTVMVRGPRAAPLEIVEDAAAKIARTPPAGTNPWGHDGRHNALFCGARRCARLVAEGRVARGDVEALLATGALAAGIADQWEIARTIRNGLRQGGVS